MFEVPLPVVFFILVTPLFFSIPLIILIALLLLPNQSLMVLRAGIDVTTSWMLLIS
jgi:hypothetical protein